MFKILHSLIRTVFLILMEIFQVVLEICIGLLEIVDIIPNSSKTIGYNDIDQSKVVKTYLFSWLYQELGFFLHSSHIISIPSSIWYTPHLVPYVTV